MTTQYAVLPARSGRTLTAKLFTLAAPDTVAFTADSVTERTNAKGEYLCTFGEASAISGDHKLVLFYGTLAAAIGFVTFAGTDAETATETPPTVALDSSSRVKLDASQPDYAPATAAALAAAKTILDKVDTGLVVDGAVYQFTANMLELGPSGSSTVTVLPATGIVADRSAGTTLTPVVGETISQSITVYQSDGTTAVNLSAKTLKVIFETMSGVDVAVVLAADITISGASSNVVTFAYPSAVTASERTLKFAIRDAAAPLTMYLQGVCSVVAAPKVDA